MTDKEKFRKEVERLKSNLIHGACSSQIAMETRCKEEAYNEVLAILDTMQEEPVSEKKCMFTKDSYTDEDRKVLCEDCKEKCEYNKKEEPVSEELEEAVDEYAPDFSNSIASKAAVNAVRDAFKAGAKWQKEQMMVKTIEGKVLANGMGNPILHLWDKGRHLIDKKVKVIVIKED